MCRYRQLWGFAAAAFGLGILVGAWLEGGFLCTCFGVALIIVGIGFIKK